MYLSIDLILQWSQHEPLDWVFRVLTPLQNSTTVTAGGSRESHILCLYSPFTIIAFLAVVFRECKMRREMLPPNHVSLSRLAFPGNVEMIRNYLWLLHVNYYNHSGFSF